MFAIAVAVEEGENFYRARGCSGIGGLCDNDTTAHAQHKKDEQGDGEMLASWMEVNLCGHQFQLTVW